MALDVPNEIKKGDPILADFLNGLVRATKANRIMPGVGILTAQNSGGTTVSAIGSGGGSNSEQIFFGKPTATLNSSQTSITLDPCDIKGTDNGSANVSVYLLSDQSALDITSYDPGGTGGAQATGCTITTSDILMYTLDAAGVAYIVGEPFAFYVSLGYSALTFSARIKWNVGGAISTSSNSLTVFTYTAVTVLTSVSLSGGYLTFTRSTVDVISTATTTDDPKTTTPSKEVSCNTPGS